MAEPTTVITPITAIIQNFGSLIAGAGTVWVTQAVTRRKHKEAVDSSLELTAIEMLRVIFDNRGKELEEKERYITKLEDDCVMYISVVKDQEDQIKKLNDRLHDLRIKLTDGPKKD